MNFNLEFNKQQATFSRKVNKVNHPLLLFNENLVKSSSTQKHIGMVLDNKLDFNLHLQSVKSKVNKAIGLLCNLENILPRDSLVTIYKPFIRPYLDYKYIIYNWVYNCLFYQNIESVEYNAALVIMVAIGGTSNEKISQ